MTLRPRARYALLAVVLAANGVGLSLAQGSPRTLGDLAPVQPDLRPQRSFDASAARAMESYRRYIEVEKIDSELKAEALRRLADLNLETGESARVDRESTDPDAAAREAIELYTTLLSAYPEYPRNDQVLYQLARAYETVAQPEKALETLDQVLKRYPAVAQLDEIEFRRGEILFSLQRYADAEAAYQRVIDQGSARPFLLQSLYKHGWSRFKQGLNEECLGSFGRVLDAKLLAPGQGSGVRPLEGLSRPDRELVEDTLRVMSLTFSYMDGPASLGTFVEANGRPAYAHLLYARLGDLYLEKQRYQDAADAYRAFVTLDPLDADAIPLAQQSIEAYRKGGFGELVVEGERAYVERYRFDGPFWTGRARADYPQVVDELRSSYRELATHFHMLAQKSARPADFRLASQWYRDYLGAFPADPAVAETRYLLAETLLAGEDYAAATTEFERAAYEYPGSPRAAAAGYAALVASQKERERLSGGAQAQWHLRQIEASTRFADSFPAHPDAGGVRVRAAQDVFALGDLPRAITLAERVLAHQPQVDAAKQRIAWTIIGQSNFDLGAFDKAEAAYTRALEQVPRGDPLHTDLSGRLAASVYRQGETRRASGDAAGAVAAFLAVAQVSPDPVVRATAEFDAAAQLINARDWVAAIGVLEGYRRRYPGDARQAEVTRNLAVAYTEAGRSLEAATEFERIAGARSEDAAVRREALLAAADLYLKAGRAEQSATTLQRFVKEYPEPVGESIEVRQRLADLAAGAGDAKRQREWQRDIVRADAAAGAARSDRTRYLAARAQLELATPARDSFRSIRLVAPLRRSLEAKRKALDTALGEYRAAADYRIAQVSSVATFEMADLYRRLGQDLMDSERPARLSAEEREQYDLLLEEQAFPFEEQAIALHEANLALARSGVFDDAVRGSLAALAGLKPARYGKTELEGPLLTAGPGTESSVELGFGRALELARSGRTAEAQREFQTLAVAAPALAPARANLGLLARTAGDLPGAERELAAAAALDPGNARILAELGLTQRRLGRFEAALASYTRALELAPADAPANRNLAVLLDVYLDDPGRALTYMERYRAAVPGDDKQSAGWLADIRQRSTARTPVPQQPAQEGNAP